MSATATDTPASPLPPRSVPARFVLIGGFLGAGKTTAIARLGAYLKQRNLTAAFITNDQGAEIVDTHVLRSKGFNTEQIEGGCFCCRFDSLTAATSRLTASNQPDVLIAEPVGSCADLIATVSNPLRQMRDYVVAPFSVLIDPARAARFFKLEPGSGFSEKVLYIYRKQLEEADFIVINKSDTISTTALAALRATIAREFPHARIFQVSARVGLGLDEWFGAIMDGSASTRPAMELDYQTYGEGESLLAWLDCTVQLSARKGFLCNPILRELALTIQRDLRNARIEIAHLKMSLTPEFDVEGLATLNLVSNDFQVELGDELAEPIERGRLCLNLRAEGKPDLLHSTVTNALTHICAVFPGLFARLAHMEHFRPGPPQPSRRISALT